MTDPIDDVDDLLAAPDATRKNETETQKYKLRKAREAARESQNRHRKSGKTPTVEDMLADIIATAEDPDTNPMGWRFRQISRKRYQHYGQYPIEFLDREFGQFSHALEVAGLRDGPADRIWRANRAKASRQEHKQRYIERWFAPYVVRPSDIDFNDDGSYLMLSISDTHSQFLDPFVWNSYLSAIRDLQPDAALWNGDTLEGAEISRHQKITGWTEPFQSELDFHREMARQVREDADFSGDFFCTAGNHGLDRLVSYMTQNAPALVSLRSNRMDVQLGLDEYDVKLFQGGSVLSPAGTEDCKPGFLLFDFYRIHHGFKLGQMPALAELRDANRSGQSGHVHRACLAFLTNERNEALSWMCTPMGCRDEAGRAYMKGTTTGWQRGFGVTRIFADGTVHQYPCIVQRGADGQERITVEGITYMRPDDMLDPPCHGQWLQDYRIR